MNLKKISHLYRKIKGRTDNRWNHRNKNSTFQGEQIEDTTNNPNKFITNVTDWEQYDDCSK